MKHSKGNSMKVKHSAVTDSEFLTRTSWVDAYAAYRLVLKGKLSGNKCALLVRGHLQKHLFKLGCFQQRHCGKVLILGLLFLSLFAVGLKTSVVESDINKLWVEENGRLTKELEYTESVLGEGYGSINQVIIQSPGSGSKNVLTRESMLHHLNVVRKATKTEVHLFDKVWRFDDICIKASFPSFDDALMEDMLNNLLPCLIVSPLDCFWEGSKVLGPRNSVVTPTWFGIEPLTWKNLNPELLISTLGDTIYFKLDAIKDTLRRYGIVSGYLKKPCLDPFDPECPVHSVNYRSKERVDTVAPAVTGGCSGFAPEYMHWEEDMIVGGVTKNRSNVMVSAEAVQTVVQVMGKQQLFNYYKGTYVVSSIDWSEEKAAQIIQVFQKKFTEAVISYTNQSNTSDSISSFTQTSLDDLIASFSQVSYLRIGIGYALMLVYAILTLMNFCDAVQSHAGVGICGVILVSVSVAAGLGLCSLLQLSFNAATTQIVPFIALGLGVDDMFLMVHAFSRICLLGHIDYQEQAGELLKRAGCTVLLTSVSNCGAFLISAIVPIPALRTFSLQVAILLLFNLISMLLVFPAVLSLDSWRKNNWRIDVVCCLESAHSSKVRDISVLPPPSPLYGRQNMVAFSEPSVGNSTVTRLASPDFTEYDNTTLSNPGSSQNLTEATSSSICNNKMLKKCCTPSLSWLVGRFYLPLIEKTSFKVIACVLSTALLCLSAYGISKVKVGMDFTEVVPRGSNEHTFLEAQSKYFGFYNMHIITKDSLQYQLPESQRLLRELYNKMYQVEYVIQKEDGGTPVFWLDMMVKWLRDLQKSYDDEVNTGTFHSTGWYYNASDDAVLAYKLLIQTGDIDNPIDKSRTANARLVDENGIVAPDAFYNYLTAWEYNDLLAYDISQATIRPEAKEWIYVPSDTDLLIPKAPAIKFARMPFYLHDLGDTDEIIKCIELIREICEEFEELGLDNYPSGVIFTFWEQYLNIRFYLLISLLAVLASIFLIVTLMLMSPLAGLLLTLTLVIITTELFGFMGLVGIKLSAIPVVILVASVGIGVEFTIHVMTGYATSIGDRQLRVKRSLSHMFTPIVHGAISTLLGVIMLTVSEFDFIIRYFFLSFLALVVLGVFNGLVLLPIILSVCGPAAEVQPDDPHDSSIQPPTPSPSPPSSPEVTKARKKRKNSRPSKRRLHSNATTLSTISEEPSQVSVSSPNNQETSTRVTPTVNVETTVTPSSIHGSHSKRRDKSVTRVKTKATVTVEVHTDIPGCVHHSSAPPSNTSYFQPMQVEDITCSDTDESETSV